MDNQPQTVKLHTLDVFDQFRLSKATTAPVWTVSQHDTADGSVVAYDGDRCKAARLSWDRRVYPQ